MELLVTDPYHICFIEAMGQLQLVSAQHISGTTNMVADRFMDTRLSPPDAVSRCCPGDDNHTGADGVGHS